MTSYRVICLVMVTRAHFMLTEGYEKMIKNINKYIDHTLLKQNATEEQIEELCADARKFDFMSVCINPTWVKKAAESLVGTDVKVCTVIGFPLGANTTNTKIFEAKEAVENGATEVDMVINVGALKDKNYDLIAKDIDGVYQAVKGKALLKVIIETCLLSDEEKIKVCEIAKEIGVGFVKTSTGFSTGGANVEDVALMRKIVGSEVGVKASGGVRSLQDALDMIEAGATRLGSSSGVVIMKELEEKSNVEPQPVH